MNAPFLLSACAGRFHPATQQQFYKYAEHLGWAIGCDHVKSREMLARIYHYQNAYELEQVFKIPGTPGPFDDAIPLRIRNTKQMQSAIAARNRHAIEIIADCIGIGHRCACSKFRLRQLLALELFSSPLAHEAAFKMLIGPTSKPLSAASALVH